LFPRNLAAGLLFKDQPIVISKEKLETGEKVGSSQDITGRQMGFVKGCGNDR
jgi:hypothetical protein